MTSIRRMTPHSASRRLRPHVSVADDTTGLSCRVNGVDEQFGGGRVSAGRTAM